MSRRILALGAAGLLGLVALVYFATQPGNAPMAIARGVDALESGLLAHNVYFTLKESNAANRQKLVDACKKYLVHHPGVVYFACGTLTPDLTRPVNDQGFDVGLHIIFKDRASHDQYQTAADHLKFIEENSPTWKQVRVFDDDVEGVASPQPK